MGKTVRISDTAHEHAKAKAHRSGMKLYRLIELAIEQIQLPEPTAPPRRVKQRTAG